jgi:hypothetical protein
MYKIFGYLLTGLLLIAAFGLFIFSLVVSYRKTNPFLPTRKSLNDWGKYLILSMLCFFLAFDVFCVVEFEASWWELLGLTIGALLFIGFLILIRISVTQGVTKFVSKQLSDKNSATFFDSYKKISFNKDENVKKED